MSRLIISTDSWHYRYYTWLRSLFGAYSKKATSLCPYCHTILWASLLLVLLSPCIILGKLAVFFLDILEKMIPESKALDFVDRATPLWSSSRRKTRIMSESGEDYYHNKYSFLSEMINYSLDVILACLIFLIPLALIVASIYGTVNSWEKVKLFFTSLWQIIIHIPYFLLECGAWIFQTIFANIGNLLYCCAIAIVGLPWDSIGSWAAIIGGGLAIAAVVSVIAVYGGKMFISLPIGKKMVQSFQHGLKGIVLFLGLYLKSSKPIKQRSKTEEDQGWTCSYCHYSNNHSRYCSCCDRKGTIKFGWFSRLVESIWNSKVPNPFKYVPTNKVLTGWETFWTFLKSAKQGVCPIVEFASPQAIQNQDRADANKLNQYHKERAEADKCSCDKGRVVVGDSSWDSSWEFCECKVGQERKKSGRKHLFEAMS